MATTKQFDMSGALFPNDKDGVSKRPDYRGDITIEGKKFRLSGWLKKGARGTFVSLAVDEFKDAAIPQDPIPFPE